MSNKTKDVPVQEVKEKSVAFVTFESHATFLEQTTANWAKLVESMDIIDALHDGSEEARNEARAAKSGIAFTLLDDIELLQDIYYAIYQNGSEDGEEVIEEITPKTKYNFKSLKEVGE